ncbi:unnamed protein product [Tilletia controversa]|nr:unnamed protein product [Tilletia controversa]
MVLSASASSESISISISGSSQPNGGSVRNGSGPASRSRTDSYTNIYDDRELSASQPARCLWLVRKSTNEYVKCNRVYPSLEHLYRHVEHAHFSEEIPLFAQGDDSPRASTSRVGPPPRPKRGGPIKKFVGCRWDKDCKRFNERDLLVAHVKEKHFDPYKLACSYERCGSYDFARKAERNEHHENEHLRPDGTSDARRKRLRLTKFKDDTGQTREENGCQPCFSKLYPALSAELKRNTTLGFEQLKIGEGNDSFNETVELPFWVECLTPIAMSNREKPARDKAIADGRISPTYSDSGFSAIGGVGSLTRRDPSSQISQMADTESSSSDDMQEDDDVRTFRNPYAFSRSDNVTIPIFGRRDVKLARRADLSLPQIPTTYQIAAEELGSDGHRRTSRHPLMGSLRATETSSEDSSSDSETNGEVSISATAKWLRGAKLDFEKRGLTVDQWRKEQRRLRRKLFQDHPDVGIESDDEKPPVGPSRLGLNGIKTSPTHMHSGASAIAGPSRLGPAQMNQNGRSLGSHDFSFAALPSIPKRALPLKKAAKPVEPPVAASGLDVPSASKPLPRLEGTRVAYVIPMRHSLPPKPQTTLDVPRPPEPQAILAVPHPPTFALPPKPKTTPSLPPMFSSHADAEMQERSDEDVVGTSFNTSRLASTRLSPTANELRPTNSSSPDKGNNPSLPMSGSSTPGASTPGASTPGASSSIAKSKPALFAKPTVSNAFTALRKDKEDMERAKRDKEHQAAQRAVLQELGRSRDDAISISSASESDDEASPERKRPRLSTSPSKGNSAGRLQDAPASSSVNERRSSVHPTGQGVPSQASTAANGAPKAARLFGPASVINRRASAGMYGGVDSEAVQSVTGQRTGTPTEQSKHQGTSSQSSSIFKAFQDAVQKHDGPGRPSTSAKHDLFASLAQVRLAGTNNQAKRRVGDSGDSDEEVDQLEDSQPAVLSQQSTASLSQSPLPPSLHSPAAAVLSKQSASPAKASTSVQAPAPAQGQRPPAKSVSPVKGPRSGQSAASPSKPASRVGQSAGLPAGMPSRAATIPQLFAKAQSKLASSSDRGSASGLPATGSRPPGLGFAPGPSTAKVASHQDAMPTVRNAPARAVPGGPSLIPSKVPAALAANPAPMPSRVSAPIELIDLTLDSDSD